MTMRRLIALVLVAFFSLCMAQSQPPPPRPLEPSRQPQQQTTAPQGKPEADQRGTKRSPLVIEALESDWDAADKKAAAEHRNGEATRNWWVAIFTGLMFFAALVQAGLFVWQLAMMRETATDAKNAARVATMSADMMRTSERAWVACVGVNTDRAFAARGIDELGKRSETPEDGFLFSLRWVNTGRTPAIKSMVWCLGRTDKLPFDAPAPAPNRPNIPPGVAPLAPGVVSTSPHYFLPQSVATPLIARECRAFIFGGAEYEEVFSPGTTRHTLVCFEIEFLGADDAGQPRFSFRADGPHNSAD